MDRFRAWWLLTTKICQDPHFHLSTTVTREYQYRTAVLPL
jgi:hypothetical protein